MLLLARTAAAATCTLPNIINGVTTSTDTYTDTNNNHNVQVTGCNNTVDGTVVTVTGNGNTVTNNTFPNPNIPLAVVGTSMTWRTT